MLCDSGSSRLQPLIPSSPSGQRYAVRRATQSGRRGLMGLSWNEVRTRDAAFAEDWKDAAYEKRGVIGRLLW